MSLLLATTSLYRFGFLVQTCFDPVLETITGWQWLCNITMSSCHMSLFLCKHSCRLPDPRIPGTPSILTVPVLTMPMWVDLPTCSLDILSCLLEVTWLGLLLFAG